LFELQSGHEGSDVAKSIKEVLSQANQWQQYARTIKRRLPADGSTGPINLPVETSPKLIQCTGHLTRLLKTMLAWCRMVSQQLSVSSEPDAGVAIAKMRELAHAAADQVYIDDYTSDNGFFDSLHGSLSFVNTTFSNVSTSLVDGHYDFDGTPQVEVITRVPFSFSYSYICRSIYLGSEGSGGPASSNPEGRDPRLGKFATQVGRT
jgi:hypothetical protein